MWFMTFDSISGYGEGLWGVSMGFKRNNFQGKDAQLFKLFKFFKLFLQIFKLKEKEKNWVKFQ